MPADSPDRTGVHDFDFFVGSWDTLNSRRNDDGVWEEFPATNEVSQHIDGLVQLDHYEATFPSGRFVKGLTIRAFDHATGMWSLIWLDNRQPPDVTPLVGLWDGDTGTFFQEIEGDDGKPIRWRYIWQKFSDDFATWEQARSVDGGATWDTNWRMEHRRRGT